MVVYSRGKVPWCFNFYMGKESNSSLINIELKRAIFNYQKMQLPRCNGFPGYLMFNYSSLDVPGCKRVDPYNTFLPPANVYLALCSNIINPNS